MTLNERFEEAQRRVKTLPSAPDTGTLLDLYALYKLATSGDVTGSRPGMLDVKGRAKWDAWAARKGVAREAAMAAYVELVERLARGAQ
jgi:carboxylesterase